MDKKNKEEMRRVAEAERLAKEAAKRAPKYPFNPSDATNNGYSGIGNGLDGSFGCR